MFLSFCAFLCVSASLGLFYLRVEISVEQKYHRFDEN